MIPEIEATLSILDENKDMLLISLLKQKKDNYTFLGRIEIESKNIDIAKREILSMLYETHEKSYDNHEKIIKIRNILNNNNCYVSLSNSGSWSHNEDNYVKTKHHIEETDVDDRYYKQKPFYCKFSKLYKNERNNDGFSEYRIDDNKNEICKSCMKKKEMLTDLESTIIYKYESNINKIITKEALELKSSIYILTNKLKQLKKNETSKH